MATPAAANQGSVDLLKTYQIKYRQFQTLPHYDPRYAHHFPFFGFGTVQMMLRDSRIRFGLGLLKGPIYAYTKFFSSEEAEDPAINQAIIDLEYFFSHKVECSDKRTEKFILDSLNHFWENGLTKALQCIEWGYSPNQVEYKRAANGDIEFVNLMTYSPLIGRPVTRSQKLIGIHLKTTERYIPMPKSAVFVHQREYSQFTGQSRLLGCHIPWHETWQMGGARDIRRMWYFKNAYDSGTMYFPEGSVTDEHGVVRSNAEIAMEIMDTIQTGSYRVLPKPPGGKQDRTWDYEGPRSNTTPDGIMEYPNDLRCEILEGLGIPREVVESNGSSGFGSSSGRKVPMLAYIASLVPVVTETIQDFKYQILEPLLKVNQMSLDYKITRIIPKVPQPVPGQPGAAGTNRSSSDATSNL